MGAMGSVVPGGCRIGLEPEVGGQFIDIAHRPAMPASASAFGGRAARNGRLRTTPTCGPYFPFLLFFSLFVHPLYFFFFPPPPFLVIDYGVEALP
jgi:hypothetical protein